MEYRVLHYKTVDNYKEKRRLSRALHFDHVKKYVDREEIIM